MRFTCPSRKPGMIEFRMEDPDGNRLWIGQAKDGPADA